MAFSVHFSAILLTKKTFVFILKAGEVIRNSFLFQSIFRPFSRHHWLLFLFWKQGNLFITLCYFNPCFSYVLDINDFCFCTGSRGNYSKHLVISSHVCAIFLTEMTFFFVPEAGEAIHNTFLIQSMFSPFSLNK